MSNNSLLDQGRLDSLARALSATNHIPHPVAEVGVYKGGSAAVLCAATNKVVHLFDTFTGMPEVRPEIDDHRKGDFADTSIGQVKWAIRPNFNYEIHQGVFPRETGAAVEHLIFAMVHLDCDIYDSIKESLEFFYPRMPVGGYLVIDDYTTADCRGTKLAVDEFFADKPEKISEPLNSQITIIKL